LNASITTASGSGFHDANFDIWQFNLDANRSIVGLPHNFAIAKIHLNPARLYVKTTTVYMYKY
jgi:hypothetical protein